MVIPSLRKLLNHMLPLDRPGQPGRPSAKPAAKKWTAGRLGVEQLEDRCLLSSTLQAISVPNANQLPSDTAAGVSALPSVSADGRYVAFQSSAPNLVPGQTGTPFLTNVFLLDRSTGAMTLVSHVPGSATTAPTIQNGGFGAQFDASSDPIISQDGQFILYDSTEVSQLVAGGPSFGGGVILYDRLTGQNTYIAGSAEEMALSGDGRYIVFTGPSTGVVPNEVSTTSEWQLYLYDRAAGTTVLVTHANGLPTTTADHGPFGQATVADDGTVAFSSEASNLTASTSSSFNVYLYTPANQTNQKITSDDSFSIDGSSSPVISGDGSAVAYVSTGTQVSGQASNLFEDNVFRYNRLSGTTTLVSGANGSATIAGNASSGDNSGDATLAISHDGRFIAFASQATNLVFGQSGAPGNVFLYDAAVPTLTLVSGVNNSPQVGAGGIGELDAHPDLGIPRYDNSSLVRMSDDGSLITYASSAGNIIPGQTGPAGVFNVFLYSRVSAQNTLVSGVNGSPTNTGSEDSGTPILSSSGNLLALTTRSANLSTGVFDANGVADVLTYTPGTPGTSLVSRSAFVASKHGGDSFATSVSADGRYTVFVSDATNLIPDQSTLNNLYNIFLYDKVTQTTTLVNHIPGFDNTTGDGGISDPTNFDMFLRPPSFVQPVISADGNFIAFASIDDDLVPGEKNDFGLGATYIYLYDRQTDQIKLVNHDPGKPNSATQSEYTADGYFWDPVISADGRYVAYAFGLPPQGSSTYSSGSLALYDSVLDTTTNITPASYLPENGTANSPVLSDDGRFVAYVDNGNAELFDRTSGSTTLVSHAFGSLTTTANGTSSAAVISHDGSFIAFVSQATNLVSGQTSSGAAGLTNIFLYHNDGSGAISLVSGVGGSANVTANGNSDSPAIDSDGSAVAYRSDATNLISGQSGAGSNIFEFNRLTASQTLVSHQAGALSTAAAGDSSQPVIDDDGHLVSYVSTAGNLIPGQSGPGGIKNVFVWVRQSDGTLLASGQEGSPTVTGNANSDSPLLTRHSFPSFNSTATNLVAGVGGVSVAYLNTLIAITLAPASASLVVGNPAGTLAGTLATISGVVGQVVLPLFSVPAGAAPDNGVFAAGATQVDGTAPLTTAVAVNQLSYSIVVQADTGLGVIQQAFTLSASAPPPPPPPLTVTINPAAGQSNPASVAPLDFTVVFSQAVSDFTTADVTLSGPAGATATVSGSGTSYTVAVSGMTQPGAVTVTVAAGGAHDANGTPNVAAAASIGFSGGTGAPLHLYDAAQAFAHSLEHYTQFVTNAYRQYLKREPETAGLNAWVSSMQAGTYSDAQVEANFIGSPEYIQSHGGTGQAWVLGMYQDLLGRTPTDAEVQGWVTALNNGTSATAVAYGFADSLERAIQRIRFNYQTYLGRTPRQDEIDGWVNALQGGASSEDMVGGFVGSPEYYLNPHKGQDNEARWIAQGYQDVLFRAASPAEIILWMQYLNS